MAKLGKDGRLCRAYKMPREVRPVRDLLRHRAELMMLRTSCKNQIHAVLHKHGIWHPFSDLFGSRGSSFLNSLDLDECFEHVVQDHRLLTGELTQRLIATERLIAKRIPEDEIIRLLKTIPGVGSLIARILRYEIWDIDRFECYSELQSYVGMAPATWQSADTVHQGRITREGNVYVRWAMVEAAQHVGRQDRYLDWKFHQLRKRKGKNKARVAVACDLLQAVYFVWKRRELYRAKPAPQVPLRVSRQEKKVGSQ
jgi:transposase